MALTVCRTGIYIPPFGPWTNFWVQHNNGSGFDNPVSYGALSVQNYHDSVIQTVTSSNDLNWAGLNCNYARLIDINGDGYPDRVVDPIESLSSISNQLTPRGSPCS